MRGRHVLALAVAAVLTASGCSSGAKDNGVAAKTAQQILDAAKAAVRAKGTVHISGHATTNGEALTLDAKIRTNDGSGTGTLTIKGARMDVIRLGSKVYVRAAASFYTSVGAPASIASLMGDKWLVSDSSGSFAQLVSFFDVDQLLAPSGTISKGARATIKGQKVIGLKDDDPTSPGTLYVRTTGDPLVVEIVNTGSDAGVLDFGDYGASVTVTAPPNPIDLSKLTG